METFSNGASFELKRIMREAYPNVTYVLWREVAALTRRVDELERVVSERLLHEKTFSTQGWAEITNTKPTDNGIN